MGGIGKSIPDAREISQDLRDFLRASRREWISQCNPCSVEYGHSRIINVSLENPVVMDQEIYPCWPSDIG